MKSPIEIYKQSTGAEVAQETEAQQKQKQQEADVEQKNLEAYALWRQNPQTQRFMTALIEAKEKLTIYCAQSVTLVPQVNNDWIRARQVEIASLNEIITNTCNNGTFRADVLKGI